MQEIDLRKVTCNIKIAKANPTEEAFVVELSQDFKLFPRIQLVDPSFETGYTAGAWGVAANLYLNYGAWNYTDKWLYFYNEDTLYADPMTVDLKKPAWTTPEEIARILEPNTTLDIQEPAGGPAPAQGSNYFKVCSAKYVSQNDDFKEYEIRLFQTVSIIQGQQYKISCKVYDTNNYQNENVQLKIDSAPERFLNNSIGNIISTDLSTTKSTIAGSYNKWQTITATFVANNTSEVLVGVMKRESGNPNGSGNDKAVFIDDFQMEYVY